MKTYQVKTEYGTFETRSNSVKRCCIVYLFGDNLEPHLNGFQYVTWSGKKDPKYLIGLTKNKYTTTGIAYEATGAQFFYDVEEL